MFEAAAKAKLLVAEADNPHGALELTGERRQHPSDLQPDQRTGGVVPGTVGNVVCVVVPAEKDDLIRILSGDITNNVVRLRQVGPVLELDPRARSATLRQPANHAAGLMGDADPGDRSFVVGVVLAAGFLGVECAGDVQQSGVLVDKDVADRPGLDRQPVLVGAVQGYFAGLVRFGGAEDDLAAHGGSGPFEVGRLTLTQIDDLSFDLAGAGERHGYGRKLALDRRGQGELATASIPGVNRKLFKVDVLQPVGFHFLLEKRCRLVLAFGAAEAGAEVIAQVEQALVDLATRPDVAENVPFDISRGFRHDQVPHCFGCITITG